MTTQVNRHAWAEANRRMFASIVHRYDLVNTVMTLGRDATWRQEAAALAVPSPCTLALDMATGTGQLAFALARRARQVVALDIAPEMLAAARNKARQRRLGRRIQLLLGDGLQMPFPAGVFDSAATAFTLRNVADLETALRELHRVLRPGGRLACLELSRSLVPPLAALHMFYMARVVPLLGQWLAGNGRAYQFLPFSLSRFLTPGQLQRLLYRVGFRHVEYRLYSLQSVAIHVAIK
ncbi:MAG: ubiquinone/menaquinone biosynthesis methyltransferase [Dehalococcoidia bacterium]